MAVLIWCSFFVVSLLGFQVFLIAVRMLLQEKINTDFSGKSFAQSFFKGMLILLGSLSLDQALRKATMLHKEQKISLRVFLVLLAFAPVSLVVPIVALMTLLMNFSGAWLGAIGLVLWVLSRFVPKIEKRSLIFIGWSVFSIGFDLILKQSALLMNAALEQPWIYWLGDSSVASCAFLLLAGVLLGLLVRLPYLTVLASLALLLSGIISLPSALSFVMGEILFWYLWNAFRELPKAEKKSGFLRTGIWAFLIVIFIFLFPWYTAYLDVFFGQEYSVLLRFDQFFIGLGGLVAVDLIISAGVFHYFSLNRVGQAK